MQALLNESPAERVALGGYGFPVVWAAVFAAGIGLHQPLPSLDPSGRVAEAFPSLRSPAFLATGPYPGALAFVRHDVGPTEDLSQAGAHDVSGGHGRFAAPGNA